MPKNENKITSAEIRMALIVPNHALDSTTIPLIRNAMFELPVGTSAGSPMHVRTYTFGCKVNKADTVAMETLLQRQGNCVLASKDHLPEVVIVNTCTVTAS